MFAQIVGTLCEITMFMKLVKINCIKLQCHSFLIFQMLHFYWFCYVGANWLIRKMASASSPDLDITQDGNKFHIKLHSLVQTKDTDFTIDEEFEETQQNGAVMKVFVYVLYI